MYRRVLKRLFDFILSLIAFIILFPFLLIFTITGTIVMKGNPFFSQDRPGYNEKVFKLLKFRTMTCEKGLDGELLPDADRLVPYGQFLRKTSIDELPSLINILKGDMAIVGPRPLLVRYLPRYTEEQHHRHDVRPGLTGYAQVNGRNSLSWEEKFALDIYYVEHISFLLDLKIVCGTVGKVLKRDGISQEGNATMEEFWGTQRIE